MIRRLTAAALVAFATTALLSAPAAAGGGGGCHEGGAFSDRATNRVVMGKICFTPSVTRVKPGGTVTFVNRDPVVHTVGGVTGVFGDPHADILSGESVRFRFEREGTFPYYCAYHPGMIGAVVVGDGQADGAASENAATTVPVGGAPGPPQAKAAADGTDKTAALALALGLCVVLLIAAIARLSTSSRRSKEALQA